MKSNHTPGPYGGDTRAARRGAAANDNANARLIAAAPAMLAALKELAAIGEAGIIERRETGKPTWCITDALKTIAGEAIAKAEGRE